jgi:hypothetical protein
LIFSSASLDNFVSNAIAGGASSVTLVANIVHGGDAPFGQWLNFIYLFNPKEQTTLTGDNYDAGDGNGNVGNITSTDNSTGNFSPALLLDVPEPATLGLVGAGIFGLLIRRRVG